MKAPRQISRRGFAKVLGTGAAYIALQKSLPLSSGFSRVATKLGDTAAVIRLSSNENPYGPSPAAVRAMTDAFNLSWRYPDEHMDALIADVARLNNVAIDQVALGNGSGEILRVAAAAFTGPARRLVIADPTFEAISRYATVAGAETVKVPLTREFSHDLPAMLGHSNTGLIYVCNPNNPTASITPKNELRSFLEKVPSKTIVLVDEAYYHYVDSPDYETVVPLIKKYPNLIVARTFSKIYGMAGLRCGYGIGAADVVNQLQAQLTWDNVNIMALAAASASLRDDTQVEQGRLRNSKVRKSAYEQLNKLGLKFIPSHANFMMINLQREARPVISALRERRVEVGRLFPSMPNYLRVTIGTEPQMDAFFTAFRQVI